MDALESWENRRDAGRERRYWRAVERDERSQKRIVPRRWSTLFSGAKAILHSASPLHDQEALPLTPPAAFQSPSFHRLRSPTHRSAKMLPLECPGQPSPKE